MRTPSTKLAATFLIYLAGTACSPSADDEEGMAGDGDGDEVSPEAPARTLSIVFDYRFDDAGFFDAPERRATLEAAAGLWSRRLTDDFVPRPVGDLVFVADPEVPYGEETELVEVDTEIDDLLLFVGCSDELVSNGLNISLSYDFEIVDAMGNEVQTPDEVRFTASDYEPWTSTLTFRCSDPWFFEQDGDAAEAPEGSYSFLTIAAHEIGHALGFRGTVPAFVALTEGGSFVGPSATAVSGGPIPLTPDGHLAEANQLMSAGSYYRTLPSELEFAVLSDLGYQVVADY